MIPVLFGNLDETGCISGKIFLAQTDLRRNRKPDYA